MPISPSYRLGLFLFAVCALHAQQVGPNVNMVTGTQWPGGDPFLQRQNEPSMAVSSRNPRHMLAGANDYRSVDLSSVSGEVAPTGDAWLGLFQSYDAGQTWTSTLIPGYPQDTSFQGEFSPIHGLGAGADPTVRAGTNGLFYYSGLAFNRAAGGSSKVFVSALTDDNNLDGGNSIRYLWTTSVDTGTSNLFLDKPSIAVDIPRSWSGICIVPALPLQNTQIFPAGTVYAAWTQFTGSDTSNNAAILYSRSTNCGLTWSTPEKISGTALTNQGAALAIDPTTGALYIAWRVFASTNPTQSDAIMYVASFDGGNTFTKPALVANIDAFDQGDTGVSFRTNDYPSIAVDASSRVYLAWSQRGVGPSTTGGDARIVVSTGIPTSNPKNVPLQWSSPEAVDLWSNRGHQIMPATAFSAGKLTVAWYDLRNDDLLAIYTSLGVSGGYSDELENDGGAPDFPSFGTYIQDPAPPYSSDARRQTLDVRAAQALPGNPPAFFPSVQVTQYPYGSVPPVTPSSEIQQLEVDPPNLPMFQNATLPFFGDYIDVAGPTFIPLSNGTWRFNNLATDPDFTHVVWTDNRDVVPPADGNWANYTPPTYGTSTTSIFDPTQTRPACTVVTTGNTGDRNQNIYTAQLAPGLVVSAPGNAKQLGSANGKLIQRQFPIVTSNTTSQTRYYQLSVVSQPAGGVASFLQFQMAGQPYPLAQIDVQVPPLSSTSRGLFVTSTNVHATVTVNVVEVNANGMVVSGGETGSVTINGDPNNPPSAENSISTTESYTPTIATPNIANPNIANPNIANPNIANPNIANPNIANPNIANPNIANPNIANPNIANPNIANPNIANTALSDGTITDGTWAVTNMGNTASAYSVSVTGQNPPPGVTLQLIIYQNYTTPLAQGCTLIQQSHFVPVANITSVTLATLQQLLNPAATNPSVPGLALSPGQTALITLRVYDANTNNPTQALNDYNPITQASPFVASQGSNTGTTMPPATLTILTKTLPQATLTGVYPAQTLQATGGTGAYTWSIASGSTPTGIILSSAGVLSGTPTGTPGTASFTVQVKDAAGDIAQQPFMLVVNPAPAISTLALPTAADVSHSYTTTIVATGGTGALTFTTQTVDGVTLSSTGQFSGTPTAPGPFAFTAKVTDSLGVSASQPLTLIVNAVPTITTTALPTAADQGHSYTATIVAMGGTAPLSFTAQTVDGVTLGSTGQFSGSPTATGSFPFTVTVTDALNVTATQALTLTVNAAPSITTTALPTADMGHSYTQNIVATGGTGTLTFTAQTVNGVTLSTTGQFSGTPTSSGSFPFTAVVTDALSVPASQPLTLVVSAAPSIITTALPTAADQGHLYTQTIAASGGTGALSFTPQTVDAVNLSSSGQFSGTPTSTGTFPFTVTVTDTLNATATQPLTLTVNAAPTITTTALPTAADQGHLYTQTIAASGGTGALSFTPQTVDGVILSSTGQFSGTPTGTGSFLFTVTVTDTLNVTATQSLTLTVNGAPSITTTALPTAADQGHLYTANIVAMGGTGTLSFTAQTVDGVTLSSSGQFSGNPSAMGTFPFTAVVTDSLGITASQPFMLVVNLPPSVTTGSLPASEVGLTYTQTIMAAGGTGSLTFTPATVNGLTLSVSGSLTGMPTTASVPTSIPVTVTDGLGVSSSVNLPLTVYPRLTLGPASLPPATLNFPYQPQQLAASGGSGTYNNFVVTNGSLPAGLSFDPSTGIISGMGMPPTAPGTNPFTVSVTDSLGATATQSYTISDGFALVGTSAVYGAGVRLTSGAGQAGAAWAGTPQSVASGFLASFQFQITYTGPYYADGLAFVIQNSGANAVGGGGGDIGYGGLSNSLAVEFDTYEDSGVPIKDPNGNHIAIISNGTAANLASHDPTYSLLTVTNDNPGITLTDGNVHNVTIGYSGDPGGTLTVTVDSNTILSTVISGGTYNGLSQLLGLSGGTAWVGFTGGSGQGGENGDIYGWSFSPLY